MIDRIQCAFLICFALFALGAAHRPSTPQVCIKNQCINVEIVTTPQDMHRGLQGRSALAEDHGMLFTFEEPGIRKFWMKDMQFPIDIVWIDANNKITHIEQNLPPCTPTACPQLTSAEESLNVLELQSNYTQTHHIQIGDTVQIKK